MSIRRYLHRIPLPRAFAPVPILPTFRLRPVHSTLRHTPYSFSPRLFNHFPASPSASPTTPRTPPPEPDSPLPPNASKMERLKYLFKRYGWYAFGVYQVFSIVDFGIAFAAINLVGAEYVSRVTESVKEATVNILRVKPPEPGREVDASSIPATGQEGLYTMLLLAFTVHKTLFLPLRVGLTAAFTPSLVGWLRRRGWAGGAGTMRAANEMRDRLRNLNNKIGRG